MNSAKNSQSYKVNGIRILIAAFLCIALPATAQRRQFEFRRSGDYEAYRNTFTGNIFLASLGTGIGCAIGAEYERTFGREGSFSFMIPVYYLAANDHFLEVTGSGDILHKYQSFYTAPGFRFHPFGSYHRADFSLGAQLAAGSVHVRQQHFDGVFNPVTRSSTFFVAPIGHVNLNLTPRGGTFVFGLHLGIGPVASGDFGTSYGGRAVERGALVQFGIKLGGRF